jgi:caffeoyl-CoA O-methyltransferase
MKRQVKGILLVLISLGLSGFLLAQQPTDLSALDSQVSRFLEEARNTWSDLNVPYEDGKTLYSLVLNGRFKNILEIGTSTGHSTIWLAWAASKTGGKVTTIEINRERYEKALANFKKAGVASYIDARLADAHQLVPLLPGPYDFIFCDADKEWYLQYFLDLEAKIIPKGCFTAHNVLWRYDPHIKKFLDGVKGNPGFRTHIEKGSGEGISVSCRIKK